MRTVLSKHALFILFVPFHYLSGSFCKLAKVADNLGLSAVPRGVVVGVVPGRSRSISAW